METLPQFRIKFDLLRAWVSLTEYYRIGRQADAQRPQRNDHPSIRNAYSSARSSYARSRSPYLEEIHQNHGHFRGIPITIAPSRSRCRRKWRPLQLGLANKRQRTDDQETCGDDICLDTSYVPMNSPVMHEGQPADEQIHALAAPVNPSHNDGNSTFTPVDTHQPIREASEIPSQKRGYQDHNLLLQPSNRESECLSPVDISGEGNHPTRANHIHSSRVPDTADHGTGRSSFSAHIQTTLTQDDSATEEAQRNQEYTDMRTTDGRVPERTCQWLDTDVNQKSVCPFEGSQNNEPVASPISSPERRQENGIQSTSQSVSGIMGDISNSASAIHLSQITPATPVPNGVDFNSAVLERVPDAPEYFDVFEYPSTGIFDVFDYPNTDVFDVFDYPSDLHPENLDNTVCNFVSRIPSL